MQHKHKEPLVRLCLWCDLLSASFLYPGNKKHAGLEKPAYASVSNHDSLEMRLKQMTATVLDLMSSYNKIHVGY